MRKSRNLFVAVVLLAGVTGFSSPVKANPCEEVVQYIEPQTANFPSEVFTYKKNLSDIAHLTAVIRQNETLNLLCKLFKETRLSDSDAIYLAIYQQSSPYQVPFITRYMDQDRRYFHLDERMISGSIFHLSIVDMNGNSEGARTGAFQQAFLHEVGHVILGNLIGSDMHGAQMVQSRGVTSVTDEATAFDEGFAIAMETMLTALLPEFKTPDYLSVYRSKIGFDLEFAVFRPYGVPNNDFVWSDWNNRDRWTNTVRSKGVKSYFEPGFIHRDDLRPLQEMATCEGVVSAGIMNLVQKLAKVQEDGAGRGLANALRTVFRVIQAKKPTSFASFMDAFLKSPELNGLRAIALQAFLETTYYGLGSPEYNEVFKKYQSGKLSKEAYEGWKRSVFEKSSKALGLP